MDKFGGSAAGWTTCSSFWHSVLGTKIPEEGPKGKVWVPWQHLVRERQGILTASPKLHAVRAEDSCLGKLAMPLPSGVL